MISGIGSCVVRCACLPDRQVLCVKNAKRTATQSAITFVELLLVIVIISVLAGILMPRFRNNFYSLQLSNVSVELQAFMNYLRERSIVDGKVIYFNIDNGQKEYWAYIKGEEKRLKTYRIPADIDIKVTQERVSFYPDGSIDKVTVDIISRNNQHVGLTTEGVYGGVKLQAQ